MQLIAAIVVAVVLVALGGVAMARRGRSRRRMGRYLRGNLDVNVSLGTLAASTGILGAVSDTVEEMSLISSIVCQYALQGKTLADDQGPISVGVAHSDYTLAEIEAWIEQTTGWAMGDKVAQEISKRLIRKIGVFPEVANLGTAVLNDGVPIKTKLNWLLTTGQNINFWFYNEGGVALATTNPNGHVVGHANLWPR